MVIRTAMIIRRHLRHTTPQERARAQQLLRNQVAGPLSSMPVNRRLSPILRHLRPGKLVRDIDSMFGRGPQRAHR